MESRFRRYSIVLFLLTSVSLISCGDGDINVNIDGGNFPPGGSGPFQLTFSLDSSFQLPHGGQPIRIAVVRSSDGMVVAEDSGIVSATQNPSFSFTPGAVLERGTSYAVHYWIDSNIGGGTPGVCDPRAIDHQWSVEFPFPTSDVNFTASYAPALTENVCSTFI